VAQGWSFARPERVQGYIRYNPHATEDPGAIPPIKRALDRDLTSGRWPKMLLGTP
jgi:hypothetical protein